MSHKVGAVLWDLDGVLVDSARFHFQAFRQLMEEQGRTLTEADFAGLLGLRNEAILQRLLGELDADEMKRLAARKEEIFRRLIAGRVAPLPGALDLVKRLTAAGVRQAIVSSTPRQNVELILDSLGLREGFAAIVAEEDAARGKPDPQGFLLAAELLGVPPEECVVLEDAPEGLAAAKSAGMRAVGVASTRPPEKLSQVDLVVPSLEDPAVTPFVLGE